MIISSSNALKKSFREGAMLVATVLLLAGCATTNNTSDDAAVNDPFEPVNRQVFIFNENVDKYFLKPVAENYVEYTPEAAREGVHNFVTNLTEPKTAVNSFLQGDLKNFGNSTTRFLVNIAFGYGGFVDRAAKEGVKSNKQDFGQTLAVWGVPAGPYIMLPFLGASDVRDTVGKVADALLLDPMSLVASNAGDDQYIYYVEQGFYVIDKRAMFLGTVDTLRDNAVDFYAKVRNIFWQEEMKKTRGDTASEDAAQAANFDEFFSGDITR
jgi:phospholipid-binding lipoprotein MlaA